MAQEWPTPLTPHLSRPPYDLVYPPSEDTFILLDTLQADHARLSTATVCLEVGTVFLSTDLSRLACLSTSLTASANDVPLNPIRADLVLPFLPRLQNSIDVLVFNPPYVPTAEDEVVAAQEGRDIEGSWAGGAEGMRVTERLLELLPDLLSPEGVFYLVAVPQNKPDEIIQRLTTLGLVGEIMLKRRAGGEHLHVLRFHKVSVV